MSAPHVLAEVKDGIGKPAGATQRDTLIWPSLWRCLAMAKLVCMRSSVSIDTSNAFSIRSAISGDRSTRWFNSPDRA